MRGNRQAFAFVFAFATVLVLFGTLPAGWGFTQPTRATCPSQLLSGRRSPWDPSIAPWVVPGGGRGGRAGVLPPLGSSADPGAAGGSGARGESSPAERRIHRRIYRRLRRVSSGVRRSVPLFLLAAAMLLPTNRAAVAAGGRSGGRAGGSFAPSSRPMAGGRGMGMGGYGGRRSHPMLSHPPGMYRRGVHPGLYMMPRIPWGSMPPTGQRPDRARGPGAGGAVQEMEHQRGAVEGGDSDSLIQFSDIVDTPGDMASPYSSRRSVRVVNPITYYTALTGAYGLIVYTANKTRREDGLSSTTAVSPLGPGVSVVKVTVALDVSDRNDPNCILSKIEDLTRRADTGSRQGVQRLIGDVALELLRKESSIAFACSSYSHHKGRTAAERLYNGLSTTERVKYDQEVNRFGGSEETTSTNEKDDETDSFSWKPTSAVVTVLLQIEGDQTTVPAMISSRSDLKKALLRIAADCQVEDCLLSAEVLWTPERKTDALSPEDITSWYPDLMVL